MTTEARSLPDVDVRRWLAEQIGLPPETSAEEIRGAFLRALPREDFVPAESQQRALALIAARRDEIGPDLRADDQVVCEKEEEQRAEVEAFAGRLFELGLVERQERWRDLLTRCAWSPPLAARLHALKPGLEVDRGALNPALDRMSELAIHVCDLFVLRPAERAEQRRAFLEEQESLMSLWEAAANELRARKPEIAALEPTFIRHLNSFSQSEERLVECKLARRPREKAGAGWRLGGWLGWAAVGYTVLRIFASCIGTLPQRDPSQSRPPSIHYPSDDPGTRKILEGMASPKPLPDGYGEALRRLHGEKPSKVPEPPKDKQKSPQETPP